MILQLSPPIWLQTPKGEGLCHFVQEMGIETELYWTVFITETNEIWTFSNLQVRAVKNITAGRENKPWPTTIEMLNEDQNRFAKIASKDRKSFSTGFTACYDWLSERMNKCQK